MNVREKLNLLGFTLPKKPEGGGSYAHTKALGENLLYVAGCGPELDGVQRCSGQVGVEVTLEEARECAVDCTLNILRALEQDLGSLDRVESFVKMTVFVACPPQFGQLPQVADASTALLSQLYGPQRGLPTRTTVGVTALANGFPVEIEVLVRVGAAPEL